MSDPESARFEGNKAEAMAAEYLLGLGWIIVTRNYQIKGGEIDLIAMDGETLVFVEVKARRDLAPESAVSVRKMGHLLRAAQSYLAETNWPPRPSRFDVVAIQCDALRHHQGVNMATSQVDELEPIVQEEAWEVES